MTGSVSEPIMQAARNRAKRDELSRYSAAARRIMARAGWTGGGLGPRGEGRTEPVNSGAPRATRGQQHPGLGTASARKKAPPTRDELVEKERAKLAADKIKALVIGTGEDAVIVYGKVSWLGMVEFRPTVKGKTSTMHHLPPNSARTVVRWKGEVVGVAESHFPHPHEWTLEGIEGHKPLDQTTVKDLTKALNKQTQIEPTCWKAWESRIGKLPTNVGERYNLRLLTPRDWVSHFKNVLHRAMLTRAKQGGDGQCRCCARARESLQHFTQCSFVGEVFLAFRNLTKVKVTDEKEQVRYDLFTIRPDGLDEHEGWVNLHLLLWKQVIAAITRVDTEDETFKPEPLWAWAWANFERKALAHQEKFRTRVLRARSRGDQPPSPETAMRPLAPLATFSENGFLVWDKDLVKQIKTLGKKEAARVSRGGGPSHARPTGQL